MGTQLDGFGEGAGVGLGFEHAGAAMRKRSEAPTVTGPMSNLWRWLKCSIGAYWVGLCLWTNYAHIAHDSVTKKAGLNVGDPVEAGQYLGDEGAVGCAMLNPVHFEVAVPNPQTPIDDGGFLIDNDGAK